MYDNGNSIWRKVGTVLKYFWITFMAGGIAVISYIDTSWVQAYANINWKLLGLQVLCLPFVMMAAERLYRLHPGIMGFGLFTIKKLLFREPTEYYSDGTPKMTGTNINFMGTDIKYVGIVMCLLLLTAIPQTAGMEEEWFRQGTTDWTDAVVRSLAFGFVHMIVGVPIYGVVVISCGGLFFSYMYFLGGIELSTQAHFQYNLILITTLLLFVTAKSFFSKE